MTNSVLKTIVLLTILTGCKITPIGYVSIEPYAKPYGKQLSMPLNIFLSDDVKDSVIVEGLGIKKMRVSDFRRSVSDGLVKVFQKNFDEVNIIAKQPNDGLVLVIYRLRPYWSRTGSSTSTTVGADGYNAITTSYISAAFQFESSLFFNGVKIGNGDGRAFSEGQMVSAGQAHKAFQDGLRIAIENIEKSIFTDQVISKIN